MRHTLKSILRSVLAAGALGGAMLVTAVAHADPDHQPLPRPVRLVYTLRPGVNAPSCADAETVERAIMTHVRGKGYRGLFAEDAPAQLMVTIARQGIQYTAVVEVHDKDGVSVWGQPIQPRQNCDTLVLDIGLIVGYQFNLDADAPEASAPPADPTPKPSADTTPPAASTPKPPVDTTPPAGSTSKLPADTTTATTTTTKHWALRAAASGGISRGASPAAAEPVFDLEAGGQWRLRPGWMISVSLGALYSPRIPVRAATQLSMVEMGTSLTTGVLAPCAHGRFLQIWAFVCAGFELGSLADAVTKNGRTLYGLARWAAFDPRFGLEVPLVSKPRPRTPQFALRAFGDFPVLFQRPTAFVAEGSRMSGGTISEAWVAPPVTGTFHLGFLAWYDL